MHEKKIADKMEVKNMTTGKLMKIKIIADDPKDQPNSDLFTKLVNLSEKERIREEYNKPKYKNNTFAKILLKMYD